MKRIRTIAISFLMLLATSCSLLGGAGDAKAKEGWKAIQGRKGETYYESCEWYFIQDISIAIGSVYKGNNVFDGKVYYNAWNDETNVWDYWKYDTKSKNLTEADIGEWIFVERNGSVEGVGSHGFLGKAAEENSQN